MPDARNSQTGGRSETCAPIGVATTSSSTPASSFSAFILLPPELANHILILACRSPPLSCKDAEEAEKRSTLTFDYGTAASLTRVSKPIGEMATSLLWQTVMITKPSALLELYAAVEKKPELAERIENLHIGGKGVLSTSEWPLVTTTSEGPRRPSPALLLKTTLSEDEIHQIPGLGSSDRHWPLERDLQVHNRPRRLAVVDAIQSALAHVDVDPYKREWSHSGVSIGLELWATRLFELQACLDLYLIEMRHVEAAYAQEHPPEGKTTHLRPWSLALPTWPQLKVTGFPSASSRAAGDTQDQGDAFVISRAQLWQHLTRRGSALDQFDHPILFARTGFAGSLLKEYGRALLREHLRGPYPVDFNVPDEEAQEDELQLRAAAAREEEAIEALGLAPQYTITGINTAVMTVIIRSKSVINLSLTGTLDLCLSFEIDTFKTIRSLSLGPLFRLWMDTSLFKLLPGNWQALENLRVCGGFILTIEASQIAGENGCFPSLKRFQWDAVQSCKPYERPAYSGERMAELIRLLQGTPISQDVRTQSRLIDIRLHPEVSADVFALLSERVQAAWKAGTLLDVDGSGNVAPHCIRITESDAAKLGSSEREVEAGVGELRAGSERWFEDCAALVKDPSLDQGEGRMPRCDRGDSTGSQEKVESEE